MLPSYGRKQPLGPVHRNRLVENPLPQEHQSSAEEACGEGIQQRRCPEGLVVIQSLSRQILAM